jgi:hypothetical protein
MGHYTFDSLGPIVLTFVSRYFKTEISKWAGYNVEFYHMRVLMTDFIIICSSVEAR